MSSPANVELKTNLVPKTTKKPDDRLLMYIVTIVCLTCVLLDVALIAYTRVVLGDLKDETRNLTTNTLDIEPVAPYFKDLSKSDPLLDAYESGELKKMFAGFKTCVNDNSKSYRSCYWRAIDDTIIARSSQDVTKNNAPIVSTRIHTVYYNSEVLGWIVRIFS